MYLFIDISSLQNKKKELKKMKIGKIFSAQLQFENKNHHGACRCMRIENKSIEKQLSQ